MTFNISNGGPWVILGVLIGILAALQWSKSWLADLRQLVDLLRTARDEERTARLKAESQRDELLVRYASTATQVISALPVAAPDIHPPTLPVADPGGGPDATVAA